MYKSLKNRNWMVLCLVALAAITSCQAGSPLDPGTEAAPSVITDGKGDVDLIGEAYGPIVADQPFQPKSSSDIRDFIEIDLEPAEIQLWSLEVYLESRHQPLNSGMNDCLDNEKYLYRSRNASEECGAIELHSTASKMSYVTYGFKEIPEGEEITKVIVRGYMANELFNPMGGLYIGVSDYQTGAPRWYGPLGTEDEYEISILNLDTTNDEQRAYVTLAVYGGDAYGITDIDIEVGEKQFLQFQGSIYEFISK